MEESHEVWSSSPVRSLGRCDHAGHPSRRAARRCGWRAPGPLPHWNFLWRLAPRLAMQAPASSSKERRRFLFGSATMSHRAPSADALSVHHGGAGASKHSGVRDSCAAVAWFMHAAGLLGCAGDTGVMMRFRQSAGASAGGEHTIRHLTDKEHTC